MAPLAGTTGSELSRGRWLFAFALVTSLFFTWGFAYGLLDVLNAHFQTIFGISKVQSTLLQLAYFGAYLVYAPFASFFMKRKGYKAGIHMGLGLYSLGAVFFWPSAVYQKYGGFVACTFVIGCGLATLEVAANSYIAVLGTPRYAAARLNFSQGFQGVASFAGPLIASRWFFTGANATKLDTVQWVYLAVAGLGIVLNVLFYFCDLPEITEDALSQEIHQAGITVDDQPFWRQWRCIFGFVAQTCYVGAQVGVAAFVVNLLVDQNIGISKSKASQLFSFCQITFTVGRFVGVAILNFVDPALLLTFYAICCCVFCGSVAGLPGQAAVGCLFALFFFESICYPCIFTLGTKNLGKHTKRGSGLIVMACKTGVGGGAWYPPAQGGLADRAYTRRSYLVPLSGYLVVVLYAGGMVISQAMKDGFNFRNVDELARKRMDTDALPDESSRVSHDDKEKAGTAHIEAV
ncbi:major facilitator superfamily domain-containing protein [Desarmillaria tabescens]|uniref:Major facilitator superfamily domain-containing protein n=1 Tax=Armillaria tabescens TaxID=1929756 RepID=A0AA39N5T0_ARMTA|nr:major facilitator superfamily domain-containing protein [Desarmillaria tabescens]KAK0459166.1 major facilitator superfamily domain-containing protein [Desarmillaria tabescens]